jgi:transposase
VVVDDAMSNIFHDYDPDQSLLFPPSPRDWLPEGHLAWFISDAVDALDLTELLRSYRPGGKGNLAYHPRLLLKLLVYGYSTGVFSSRKIAGQVEDSVAFRVLAAGQSPNHRTICRFREQHIDHFNELFAQVVQLAQQAGLVKLGTIAIDGTRVKANASKHKAMSYERMKEEEKRLRDEIRKITAIAAGQDAAEDAEFGPDFRGDELPEELQRRESRRAVIRAAKKRLEERKAEEAEANRSGASEDHKPTRPEPKDQENFTDPESRIMKVSSGVFEQAYNAQISVDSDKQIIVATGVTQCAADVRQLIPMLDETMAITEEKPRTVLADAGYRSEENFLEIEHRQLVGLVPLARESKTPSKKPLQPATARMKQRLGSQRGRARYKMRKWIVEPVIGWIKQVLGFRVFSLRGFRKITGEWDLVCLALNLRRMNKMMSFA